MVEGKTSWLTRPMRVWMVCGTTGNEPRSASEITVLVVPKSTPMMAILLPVHRDERGQQHLAAGGAVPGRHRANHGVGGRVIAMRLAHALVDDRIEVLGRLRL